MRMNRHFMLLLSMLAVACIVLWFGGIGDFLAVVTLSYWVGLLRSRRRLSEFYGGAEQMLLYLLGGGWVVVTYLAFRYANVSLLYIVHLLQ